MIDIISLTGLAGSSASIFGVVSAIKSGKNIDYLMSKVGSLDKKIETINNKISIFQDRVLRDLSRKEQRRYNKKTTQREILTPIQKELNSGILSSVPIVTPDRLKLSLDKNPRDILLNVDKLSHIELHNQDNMVPVVFFDNGSYFVGWQLLSAVELLFGLEFDSKKFDRSIQSIIERNINSGNDGFELYRDRSNVNDPVALYDLAVMYYLNAKSIDDVMISKELLEKSSRGGYELADLRLELLEGKVSLFEEENSNKGN